MTEKLYHQDSSIKEFKAHILNIEKFEDNIGVILDKTYFYPDSGGQLHDTGFIDNIPVVRVLEKNGVILHLLKEKPLNKKDVFAKINWSRRFDHMQQHSGQHLLSQCFIQTKNTPTFSIHLGEEVCTIDIKTKNLKLDDIYRAENLANTVIYQNIPIKNFIIKKEDIDKYPLRRSPKIKGDIRIIEIADFDFTPCGGTHCKTTGEIGIIKILKWENYKGNTRVSFICGSRCLKDYQLKNSLVNELSTQFSTNTQELLKVINKLREEQSLTKKELLNLKNKLIDSEIDDLYNNAKIEKNIRIIKNIFKNPDQKYTQNLYKQLMGKDNSIILFGLDLKDKANLIFARSQDIGINMNEILKNVMDKIEGKGGGNPNLAQAGGKNSSGLNSALDAAEDLIKSELK